MPTIFQLHTKPSGASETGEPSSTVGSSAFSYGLPVVPTAAAAVIAPWPLGRYLRPRDQSLAPVHS